MRSVFAVVLVGATASVLFAQVPQRLAFDSTHADTATCNGLRVQFLDFRADQYGGNGFVVRVRNPSSASQVFNPAHLSFQLKNRRTLTFLTGRDIGGQYLEGSRVGGMDTEERFRTQLDIQSEPRYKASPVSPNSSEERFLALGWSRSVTGDPAQLLPTTLFCGRDTLGQIGFVVADHR
jgi:opacity protein-like surface antigen